MPTLGGHLASMVGALGVLTDELEEVSDKITTVNASIEEATVAIESLEVGGGGSSTQAVSVVGTVTIAEPITIDGTIALDAGTLAALEVVSVANLPAVQPVNDNGGSLTVDGTVGISGTVSVSGPLTDGQLRAVAVPVTDSRLPAALDADGGLKVHAQSAVPVTDNAGSLTVDGTISVANFPAAQPVTDNGGSLTVDGTVSVGNFPAVQPIRELPNVTTWVSAKTAAPTANSVQADTGALAAGDYDFFVNLTAADTVAVGKGLVIEHRNAANGATLFSLGGVTAGESNMFEFRRYAIAANERIRVIAGTAAGAASSMYVSAIGRRLT